MLHADVFALPLGWLSESDRALAQSVGRWAEQELISRRHELGEDYAQLLAPALSKLLIEIGIQGLFWPEERGGAGMSDSAAALSVCAVLERVSRGDVGLAYVLANSLALQAAFCVEPYLNPTLRERMAERLCSGRPATAALVLPDFATNGSTGPLLHGLSPQVNVRRESNGLVLNGTAVRPTCAGQDAALFGVICAEQEDQPMLVLVPADAAGLSRGALLLKTGMAGSRNVDLSLSDVRVPDELIVWRGAERYADLLAWYYMGCAACCLGAGLAGWEILKEWGETRVIKGRGQVFKDNPLAAGLMGRISGKIGIARLLAYELALLIGRPAQFGDTTPQSRLAAITAGARQVCDLTFAALDSTMELMASAGYAAEWQLERFWRDVRVLQGSLGPAPALDALLARHYVGSKGV